MTYITERNRFYLLGPSQAHVAQKKALKTIDFFICQTTRIKEKMFECRGPRNAQINLAGFSCLISN